MSNNHFEVRYWNLKGDFMTVEVIAEEWVSAGRMVSAEPDVSGVDGVILIGVTSLEPCIKKNTKEVLRYAHPE